MPYINIFIPDSLGQASSWGLGISLDWSVVNSTSYLYGISFGQSESQKSHNLRKPVQQYYEVQVIHILWLWVQDRGQ